LTPESYKLVHLTYKLLPLYLGMQKLILPQYPTIISIKQLIIYI